ncbi:L-pipecolate oxidase [Fusarium oxysporum f. sp. albedinis]|nr:L-pipecolate oxidase [Fusarium oxysporum f. sp. albedinis]
MLLCGRRQPPPSAVPRNFEPGCNPGSSRSCKEEEVLWAVHDCRDRSSNFRAAKRAASHLGPVRRDKGAPKGPRSRAASGCWCCSGSKSCRGRSRQRKAAGEGEGEGAGATTLNVERQDAANVVWAARAAEVGRTGSRGRRVRIVEGSRSRNVEVRRSRK